MKERKKQRRICLKRQEFTFIRVGKCFGSLVYIQVKSRYIRHFLWGQGLFLRVELLSESSSFLLYKIEAQLPLP